MTPSDNCERHARCLCGAIHVTIHGPLADMAACHCGQCRHCMMICYPRGAIVARNVAGR